MKKTTLNIFRAGAIAVGLAMTGNLVACTANGNQESTGEYVDDATISTNVRAAIVGDKDVKITQISVTTFRGTVQLSGFVDNAGMITRAGELARGVKGVKSVDNDIKVKQ
jgi:osmotically-inducible protein OsmY